MISILKSICVVFLAFFLGSFWGCNRETPKQKARKNSQWIIDHIYSDSVFAYLQSKYLPYQQTQALIRRFRERFKQGSLRGGYKKDSYYINLTGNNEVLFLYEYKSTDEIVKINLNYELVKDTFEVKALIIDAYPIQ